MTLKRTANGLYSNYASSFPVSIEISADSGPTVIVSYRKSRPISRSNNVNCTRRISSLLLPVNCMSISNVVWFKKDLRVNDHEPLRKASESGSCIGLFIVEPEWIKQKENSGFQISFVKDSIKDLQLELSKYNIPLLIRYGQAIHCLDQLKKELSFNKLYSHEETGLWWTYQRDIAVKHWCKLNSVIWNESRQFSVIRGLKDRDRWASLRKKIITRPMVKLPIEQSLNSFDHESIDKLEQFYKKDQYKNTQKGGVHSGLNILKSFLSSRGENYQKEMTSPVTAFKSSSRLSPHITWGTLSLTEIQYWLNKAIDQNENSSAGQYTAWGRSLNSFEKRLWWHCHFIQKMESEPEIEFENINRGFDGMREGSFNQAHFEAWKKGETGFPMIDACMRALHKYGWINFRMRAMLLSFACYQLWLHWKEPALYLGSLFTDFEPGIHYSQVQMLAGVTGINTIRIYSPTKQGLDKDPKGEFIKKLCPELSGIDTAYIHNPSAAPPMIQILSGVKLGVDYPAPIVDAKKSYQIAKDKIFSWRTRPEVKDIGRSVYTKHGSRKNKHFPKQHRKSFGRLSKK